VVASFGPAAASHAVPITYGWTATIFTVSDNLSDFFSVGDALSGSVTLDSQTPDESGDPSEGVYSTTEHFTCVIGDQVATIARTEIGVSDGSSGDSFRIDALLEGFLLRPGDFFPTNLQMILRDAEGTAFTSDDLPTLAGLAAFEAPRDMAVFFYNGAQSGDVGAHLTSFNGVPEPRALVALGLAGLALAARLTRDQRRGRAPRAERSRDRPSDRLGATTPGPAPLSSG
jgi:hypothetical protein